MRLECQRHRHRARRLEQEIVQKHELLLNKISASAREKASSSPRATPKKENRRFQRELKTNDFPGARITSNLYPAGSGKTKFCKPTAGTRPRAGAQSS
ncbi:hypothetical protein [uncultured Rikenella sp.]|uniref:hypothetical protein n=1 Tax=uncultured Rikenella sp. TaxID=368003 RepID=UPI002634E05E|nr:hypothetical protein [uncultured Rikenella sp.]